MASKSTGEALYVSSCSDNDLPHTILHNTLIALREDKLEYGHGGSDAYMKIACCYNLLVGVLTSCSAKDSNASNFLTHGAPCFLICLIGTQHCSLVLASIDLIPPRADVDRMWWVL